MAESHEGLLKSAVIAGGLGAVAFLVLDYTNFLNVVSPGVGLQNPQGDIIVGFITGVVIQVGLRATGVS